MFSSDTVAGPDDPGELAEFLADATLRGYTRSPAERAEQIAGQIFTLGRVQPVAEIVAQLDAVDAGAPLLRTGLTVNSQN